MCGIKTNTRTKTIVEDYDLEVFNNKTTNLNDFYNICKEIVEQHQFQLINFLLIDVQSANMFVMVWDTLRDKVREKMQNWFDQGMKIVEKQEGYLISQSVTAIMFKKLWGIVV